MKLKERHERNTSIFTDSMADISFLLVIFFMVTSVVAVSRGLDWQVPEQPEVDPPSIGLDHSIDVHILDDGTLEVDRKPMSPEKILSYIKRVLLEDPKKPVILRADPDARYASMIDTFDLLRQAPEQIGFEINTLAIPTLREQNGWDRYSFD